MKMNSRITGVLLSLTLTFLSHQASAQVKVMTGGVTTGQLVELSADDVVNQTAKYKSLNPLSIPVFGEMPLEMSVTAGAITIKQQNLNSHVQLKSRARHKPNLDISRVPDGLRDPVFKGFKDGDWVTIDADQEKNTFTIVAATEAAAEKAYSQTSLEPVELRADLSVKDIFSHSQLTWKDADKVGSKAANYAELMRVLNDNPEKRVVVRPGFAIPFYYYQEFLDMNPKIKEAIDDVLNDPLMEMVADVSYREEKLKAIRDLMTSENAVVDEAFLKELIKTFDDIKDPSGLPRKMKLRSSTNSEDLPNFNGAGLYTSESYKPVNKKGEEKKLKKKLESMRETLQTVWASVWTLRAFDERSLFKIPHQDVKMAEQVNLSFANEKADGVVITKNIAGEPSLPGDGVYIEAQRGDEHSVANPQNGVKPMRILVSIDRKDPLNKSLYKIHVLQMSNIGDDNITILSQDNPKPVIADENILDLTFQCLKAEAHWREIHGKPDMALDLEFKVDAEDTGVDQVYLKQARPYLN